MRAQGLTIPSSTSPLTARTLRARRPAILSNHPIARRRRLTGGHTPRWGVGESIQKIISLPITSRKNRRRCSANLPQRASLTDAGTDFTQPNPTELQSWKESLEKPLTVCQTAEKKPGRGLQFDSLRNRQLRQSAVRVKMVIKGLEKKA